MCWCRMPSTVTSPDRPIIVSIPVPRTGLARDKTTLLWRVKTLVSDVPYATTISLIASGLVKLSKLQRTTSLYRGIGKGRSLPEM